MFKRNVTEAFKRISSQWLENLNAFDDNILYTKPTENEWCMAELYDHIMRVARTYQIPNFYNCINNTPKLGAKKNIKGYIIFDLNFLPKRKIKIASFPNTIITDFTPQIRERKELTEDFKNFINEGIAISGILKKSNTTTKNHHPFFGMISAREWFSLMEIHMRHHQPQKKRLEQISI